MQNVYIEWLGYVPSYLGIGIKVLAAVILGGLVGWDRETKMKAAGIKTNILICLGATIYTAVSLLNHALYADSAQIIDPSRITAQIVSGIGFLGAGAIIQGRGNVVGMTTAATIWLVAAIGVTVGSGYPLVATLFTLTCLVVLKLLGPIYRKFELKKGHNRGYHVEVLYKGRINQVVKDVVLNFVDDIAEMTEEIINIDTNEKILNIYVKLHPRKMPALIQAIKSIIQVVKVTHHKVDISDDDFDEDDDH